MNESNKFYKKVQMYLMKKNQECGELKLFTTCATSENIIHIDDICQSITEIFETNNIPTKEKTAINNEQCVESYKYLLLNTKFNNQGRLTEDIVYGHLVDMCPPLSPFLFVQIMWNLEYEQILIESLLYVPLDLCTEILEIVTKCIDKLPFQRFVKSMYRLVLIIYTKFLQLKETGIQSMNVEKSIQMSLFNFEQFLLVLTNSELSYLTELSGLKRYERHGIMLKKLICTIRKCLENKPDEIICKDLEKLYEITFGSEPFVKYENIIEDTMLILNKQLVRILLNKIKEIDCNIYLNWAELDDEENNMISLQRSIGIECYYFIEFIKNDGQFSQDTHLIECLQQLSSKPDLKQSNFVLNLQELCCAISDGKTEFMKELLCRYKEWDRSMLEFVYDNSSLLDKKDFLTLLEYLTFVLSQPTEESLKEFSYTLVTKLVALQSVPDIYEIVVMYVTKYDGKNYLESSHTEEVFNDFITRNANLQTPIILKTVLLFLLKNPKTVLTVLVKITIGHPQYENIMISARDLLLLSPFMQIREDNSQLFLINILKTICTENLEWNAKKFMDFIQITLDSSIFMIHDLINSVFIPYLKEDTLNVSNINSILNIIRKLQVRCTKDTDIKNLIIALAGKMSFLRKNPSVPRYISSEVFVQMTRILEYFLKIKSYKIPLSTKKEIINQIEYVIEPIDKLYFSPLWFLTEKGVSVIDIVDDYERRCFSVLNRLKKDPQTSERLRTYLSNLNLVKEDYLRHLILRSVEGEYQRLSSELIIIYWFAFGWNNETEAYDHFLRLTVEACSLVLEYPPIGGKDLFAFLIKSLTRFCRMFISLEELEDKEHIYKSIVKNVDQLSESIKQSPYADLFIDYSTCLSNHTGDDYLQYLQDVLNFFHYFSDQCLEYNHKCNKETRSIPHSRKVSRFYTIYEVISACLRVPAIEACDCITRLNELFVSN